MISTTFTTAPTYLGLGSADERPAAFAGTCTGVAEWTGIAMSGARAQLQGRCLPGAVQTAVRRRPAPQHKSVSTGFIHNDGTTLGNPSSRRPLS
ncbi:MAG: hypothetical protein JF630_14555 [Geodermatophilales bacterium]|nr:hypothetical protein [Geodermatophilales bacterium]